jgi:hypothetical protein
MTHSRMPARPATGVGGREGTTSSPPAAVPSMVVPAPQGEDDVCDVTY